MATKTILFVLGFIVTASNAAFSMNDLTLRQEDESYIDGGYEYGHPEHPELQALRDSEAALKLAFEGVMEQLGGFDFNTAMFRKQFEYFGEDSALDLISTFLPLFEAAPPPVLKTFIIDFLNGIISAVEQLRSIMKQYNPLHPQEALDLRSLIRRRLTTLSTFGGAVEHLITAVDKFVINYVDALEEGLEQRVERGVRQVVVGLEQAPAEMVATMVVQTLKETQEALKFIQAHREGRAPHS